MLVEKLAVNNLIVIRLNPGDDILESLRKAARDAGIKNAAILSGAGSARSYHYHVVSSRENPPTEDYIRVAAPSDIVNINGFIINGRVHAHIIHSDKDKAFGGHLEPGVEVLTFAIITLAEIDYNLDKFDSIGDIEELRQAP
jgi:predicted DNA-binding protein with PD1-like motif